MPVAPAPVRKKIATSAAISLAAAAAANRAEVRLPHSTARRPALPSAAPSREAMPTFSTSAAATPSGYGRSDCDTSARRSGTVYITPSTPPTAQAPKVGQNGTCAHKPIISRPGKTKITEARVPAAEAMVWTMLFSWMVASLNALSSAIEITAAGIEVAKVRPTFRPR
jgi:hypothetical protein